MPWRIKISNSNVQITNKSQIPILNDQNIGSGEICHAVKFGILNFGDCDLFEICNLGFVILRLRYRLVLNFIPIR